MSNYQCKIKVKKTGKIYKAIAVDNYFGKRRYGYKVNNRIYEEDEVEEIDESN